MRNKIHAIKSLRRKGPCEEKSLRRKSHAMKNSAKKREQPPLIAPMFLSEKPTARPRLMTMFVSNRTHLLS